MSDEQLRLFFDNAMSSLLASAGAGLGIGAGSVVAVQVNKEKLYAFVEFRSPEEATTAMALDGITMEGNPMKVSLSLLFVDFFFFSFLQ